MDYNGLRNALRRREFANAYLFAGPESYIKRQAVEWMRGALLPAGFKELNETVMDDPRVDELIAAAETLPIFADRRLVVVRSLKLFTTEQQVTDAKAQTDALIEYLPRIPSTVSIVFLSDGKLDARRRIVKAVDQAVVTVWFDRLDDATLSKWIVKEMKNRGVEISMRNASFLSYWSGNDMTALGNEIGKLCAYRSDAGSVCEDDIRTIATRVRDCSVFEWLDSLLRGEASLALSMLDQLLEQNESPVGLLALLASQIRRLTILQGMEAERRTTGEMRNALDMNAFAFDRLRGMAVRLNAGAVRDCADALIESDEGFRQGRFSQDDAIKRAVFRILAAV